MLDKTAPIMTGKRKRSSNPQTYGRRNTNNSKQWQRARSMFFPSTDQIDMSQQPTAPPVPPKPRSQKEAMMPAQASEDTINTVVAFSGCTPEAAARYLRVKQNDPNQAINAILENEDISKAEAGLTWDEGPWTAGRDGEQSNDGTLRPLGTSAAPTRGNSPAGSFRTPTNQAEADEDYARALAASQTDFSGQETGVVGADGTSKPAFGPANRNDYDPKQWAMVPSTQGASEVIPDVDAEMRKNVDGEPRFLKHSTADDYLPNFLTICHSISAAREALLFRDYPMRDYGTDAEWWKGHSIALPKIVHTEDGAPADPEVDKYDDFIAELQRIMAFLDGSERSYASAHALANTEMLRGKSNKVESFMQEAINAAEARCRKRGEFMRLFSTNVGTTAPEGMVTPYLEHFDLPVDITGDAKLGLPELLDNLLWDTSESAESNNNYIQQGADILVMRVKQQRSEGPLRVEAPAQLYIDKYLQENIETSKEQRLKIADKKRRLAKIENIEARLTHFTPSNSSSKFEAKALLQHSIDHFSGKNLQDAQLGDSRDPSLTNGHSSSPTQPHYAAITEKLSKLTTSIDAKLAHLSQRKQELTQQISNLSNSSPSSIEPKDRYTLVGVSTKPNITYLLRPNPDASVDGDAMSTDGDGDNTPDGMQWWRIEYSAGTTSPHIDKTKVPDYDVLRAVELEHSSALLVYISDHAASVEPNPVLPEALRQFVEDDNRLFENELKESALSKPPPAYEGVAAHVEEVLPARESIERSSLDSMRAEADEEVAEIRLSPRPGEEDEGGEVEMEERKGG